MLFSIINPSDPYTMEAPDLEIAAVAVCLIGNGKYALREISGDQSGFVPMFPFGGHDAWFMKQFDRDFSASVKVVSETPARRTQLIKALASVNIGDIHYRREFDQKAALCTTPEEAAALWYSHHDAKRTSENDIGRRAWALGQAVLESSPVADPAPNDDISDVLPLPAETLAMAADSEGGDHD
jgi:hypothetical protein